jgi:glucose-6-phosphate 1-epimerase
MDLPRLDVNTAHATAQLFCHGAQLTQWTPAHAHRPVLWTSAYSRFRPDEAIRGGVPICFPWFGAHPTDAAAPAHGFVRRADWTLIAAEQSGDDVTLRFAFDSDDAPQRLWPQAFRLVQRVTIGATLTMALDVENRSDTAFTFEEALHTYFTVGDIKQATIVGLENTAYLDKPTGFTRQRQADEAIRFAGETDRVYLDTTAECRIVDPVLGRTIVVAKSGSRSTVVWNPWIDRARALPDFGDQEWRAMVCVETANIGAAAVHLAPGVRHTMRVDICVF